MWHCYYLKTPSNNSKPHFNIQTKYSSWHRDRIIDYKHDDRFFRYNDLLNDVDIDGGGFGFLPIRPDNSDEVDQAKKS